MLVELVRELARQQAIANVVRDARQEPNHGIFAEQRLAALNANVPLLRATGDTGPAASDSPAVSTSALLVDGDIDVFI